MQSVTTHPPLRPVRARFDHCLALVLCCLLPVSGVPASAEPIGVRAVDFDSVATPTLFSAPATVVARNEPAIAAEIEARIIEIPVDVGDPVGAGDVVARLDCRRPLSVQEAARAELARAQAQQRFAADQLARARDLNRRKSISEETLDQRRTDLATAEAATAFREEQLRQAEIDVGHCELHAPLAGVVTHRHVSVGSYASRGMVIIGLIQTDGQEVSVALRHGQAETLQAAGDVSFDHDGRRYPVTLRTLLPYVDTTTRTREARLAFTAVPAAPGTAGRLTWQDGQRLLPPEFLLRRDGRLGVLLLDGERARFHAIPDAEDGRPVAVDLAPGTRLISDGRQRLSDGDPVRLIAADE
jgi:RND family efflux transporter MFP subunit